MKNYKPLELQACNSNVGSYAAGCPPERSFKSQQKVGGSTPWGINICAHCEVAQ